MAPHDDDSVTSRSTGRWRLCQVRRFRLPWVRIFYSSSHSHSPQILRSAESRPGREMKEPIIGWTLVAIAVLMPGGITSLRADVDHDAGKAVLEVHELSWGPGRSDSRIEIRRSAAERDERYVASRTIDSRPAEHWSVSPQEYRLIESELESFVLKQEARGAHKISPCQEAIVIRLANLADGTTVCAADAQGYFAAQGIIRTKLKSH